MLLLRFILEIAKIKRLGKSVVMWSVVCACQIGTIHDDSNDAGSQFNWIPFRLLFPHSGLVILQRTVHLLLLASTGSRSDLMIIKSSYIYTHEHLMMRAPPTRSWLLVQKTINRSGSWGLDFLTEERPRPRRFPLSFHLFQCFKKMSTWSSPSCGGFHSFFFW